jgi:hypothetical protein
MFLVLKSARYYVTTKPSSTGVLSTGIRTGTLNRDMGRCVYCHSVVVKDENQCYLCGESMPKQTQGRARTVAQQHRTAPLWINLAFLGSLACTFYGFFSAHILSLPVTLVISLALVLIRILAEWLPAKNSN